MVGNGPCTRFSRFELTRQLSNFSLALMKRNYLSALHLWIAYGVSKRKEKFARSDGAQSLDGNGSITLWMRRISYGSIQMNCTSTTGRPSGVLLRRKHPLL